MIVTEVSQVFSELDSSFRFSAELYSTVRLHQGLCSHSLLKGSWLLLSSVNYESNLYKHSWAGFNEVISFQLLWMATKEQDCWTI
jgi:hypothetical protein